MCIYNTYIHTNSSVTVLCPESWFWKMPASFMKMQPHVTKKCRAHPPKDRPFSENGIIRK